MRPAWRGLWTSFWQRWFRVLASLLAGCVGLAAIGYVALSLAPNWVAGARIPESTCDPGERTFTNCLDASKARADDRRGVTTATLALIAGGLSAFGVVYTARTFALNRESGARSHELDRAGQLTERFTRAVGQLGSLSLDVRLGGIYALERIARDSEEDHPQVLEILTAYVREHAPWSPKPSSTTTPMAPGPATPPPSLEAIRALERIAKGLGESADAVLEAADEQTFREGQQPRVPTDVHAAISVLGRRDASRDREGTRLDLSDTDLRGIVLRKGEANFQGALFVGATLQGARLLGANLEDTRFMRANLRGAMLANANLRDTYLNYADLEGANLTNADLQGVRQRMGGPRSNLTGAHLQDADLFGVNLRRARLVEADLQRATLTAANLQDTDLRRANLQGAALGQARLDGALLTDTKLKGAKANDHPTWPKNFDAQAAGVRED